MEKYGVENVLEGMRLALENARAKLLRLQGVLQKTASEEQEDAHWRAQIAELEAAMATSGQ